MLSRNLVIKFAPAALLAALLVLPGCSINVKDKGKEGEKRVDIETPMGGIHVDAQPDVRETGLSLYAGARPAKQDSGEDKKSANVNINGPGFMLKVVAAEFESDDAPEKIIAYYDKELQKFGKPIECHGKWNGGDVNVEKGGKDDHKPVTCRSGESGDTVELKVGTEDNQHIVAVKPDGKGTHFALVYVRTRSEKGDTI
ncbi:MAG TPA: hypothetical protein VLT90_15495 [Terriglobales bacterium]|nr:hypothetical protein [Terriglobales bacterium]